MALQCIVMCIPIDIRVGLGFRVYNPQHGF